MNKKSLWMSVVVCAFAMLAASAAPASAQDQTKEKPPMYTYVANWAIPRAQWADMEKSSTWNQSMMEKAMADGSIVGYGNDLNEVHQVDGATHDNWWSSMSMAGLMKVLDNLKSGSTPTVLDSATRHWDQISVSRHYNWRSGSYKGAYTRAAEYKLKPDAPDDAIEFLSKTLFVPLLEKLLADGTILEYEVDTEAIHTENPAMFAIVYITPNAEGLDKFDVALREAQKTSPLGGPAFGSMVDFTGHRDYLDRSLGTYK